MSGNAWRRHPIHEREITMKCPASLRAGLFAASFALACAAHAVDVDAARALAKQNNCFKCHGVDKKGDGPAYKDVAAKYRGKANAEERLMIHLTTGEKAKFDDGHEEDHKIIKTSPPKDTEQIKNLIHWILAL